MSYFKSNSFPHPSIELSKVLKFFSQTAQTIEFHPLPDQQKRNKTDMANLQQGYASNFGAGAAGPGSNRAIDAHVMEAVLRVLVTRFALMHKELKMLDNSVRHG